MFFIPSLGVIIKEESSIKTIKMKNTKIKTQDEFFINSMHTFNAWKL